MHYTLVLHQHIILLWNMLFYCFAAQSLKASHSHCPVHEIHLWHSFQPAWQKETCKEWFRRLQGIGCIRFWLMRENNEKIIKLLWVYICLVIGNVKVLCSSTQHPFFLSTRLPLSGGGLMPDACHGYRKAHYLLTVGIIPIWYTYILFSAIWVDNLFFDKSTLYLICFIIDITNKLPHMPHKNPINLVFSL